MGLIWNSKCPRCGRKGRHTKCSRELQRHERELIQRGVDPKPHKCPNEGCGRTVFGGVCPGPYC